MKKAQKLVYHKTVTSWRNGWKNCTEEEALSTISDSLRRKNECDQRGKYCGTKNQAYELENRVLLLVSVKWKATKHNFISKNKVNFWKPQRLPTLPFSNI
jgi:nucleoid-associated protein YejK